MSDPTAHDPSTAESTPPQPTQEAAEQGGADQGASPAQPGDGPPTADQVRMALRKVKDPELNLNIVDLGLVYEVTVDGSEVQVDMTLTSPGCPAGPQITGDVERAVRAVPGVTDLSLNIVWEPFWSPDRIEPRVRAYMGL